MTPRVVMDADQLVANILYPRGEVGATILQNWHSGLFDLVICPSLIRNVKTLVHSRYIKRGQPFGSNRLGTVFERIRRFTFYIDDPPGSFRDRGAGVNYVSLAVAAGAGFLVTANQNLLGMVVCDGCIILTPAHFAATCLTLAPS